MDQAIKAKVTPEEAMQLADRARRAFEIIEAQIVTLEKTTGQKMPLPQKMMFKSMKDGLPVAFELMPDVAKAQAEMMYNLMGYVLGYQDSPTGEE